MKKLILITLFLFSITYTFGQEATVTTDKMEYKFDEIIELTFKLNAKFDSLEIPNLENFKIISGPNESFSVSIQNGITTQSKTSTYRIKPLVSGQLKIMSATFYKDGKEIKGNPIIIKVDPSTLTDKEIQEKEYQNFIEDGIKPKGTTRIMLHESKGYIEILGERGWKFHRRLTNEEIEQVKKIK